MFHEKWWLDLATNRTWKPIEYVEAGKCLAWMPHCPERLLWLRRSRMPTLTHFLGPVVTIDSSNEGNRAQASIYAIRQLLQQFPPVDCFRQTTHRGVEDVLAFQMEGFTTVAQFTFVIDHRSPDQVWRSMRDKVRNAVRSAQRTSQVVTSIETEEFLQFYAQNLVDRGRRSINEFGIMHRLVEAARARGRGTVHAALDDRGRLQGAIFCAWDDNTSFYLMSTRAAASHSGCIALLLWHAIQDALAGGRSFDFDGVTFAGSAPFIASFGAKCEPRYLVSRLTRAYSAARGLTNLMLPKPGTLFDRI